ncbi:OmpH family outer membrane protein [uncultured Ilyobacter sp.]|uniref:OmpH family outer membrane protein n=1 Tax=uncultured Ilyobacter sp. TaxID=544433 RepID=UPI0029C6B4F8|nr:OmpH family outer membrane protein [uncultured Ilyobacter sp.]
MKKLTILALAATMSMSAFAMKVGYVSSQEVFSKYSGTKIVKEQLVKEKSRLENEIKRQEVELQKLKVELQAKGNSVTQQEKSKFQKQAEEFQKYVNQAQMNLNRQEQEKFSQITKNIDASIQSIAKREKFDYVFEEGAIKFGGEDITQKVINQMEKGEKIKLN